MSPNEKFLLLRAESLYLRRWTDAFINGNSVRQRFYAHRLDEVRMCRNAQSISDEFRRYLMSLFQSCSPETNRS